MGSHSFSLGVCTDDGADIIGSLFMNLCLLWAVNEIYRPEFDPLNP